MSPSIQEIDPDKIWLLASTFSRSNQYYWRYPINFKISDRLLQPMRGNSWRSIICTILVRSTLFFTAFSLLSILFFITVSNVEFLQKKQIIIYTFALVCYVVGFLSYCEMSGNMETIANVGNALVWEYHKLGINKCLTRSLL